MSSSVQVDIDPISVADRLRKRASEAADEDRHDDAFLMDVAANTIGALVQGPREIISEVYTGDPFPLSSGRTRPVDLQTSADACADFAEKCRTAGPDHKP